MTSISLNTNYFGVPENGFIDTWTEPYTVQPILDSIEDHNRLPLKRYPIKERTIFRWQKPNCKEPIPLWNRGYRDLDFSNNFQQYLAPSHTGTHTITLNLKSSHFTPFHPRPVQLYNIELILEHWWNFILSIKKHEPLSALEVAFNELGIYLQGLNS